VILFGISYFFTEFGPNTTTFVYRIVVGVDGSENSEHALVWANEQAGLREDGELTVVFAWQYPIIGMPGAFAREELEAEAKTFLRDEVAAVIGASEGLDLVVAQGDPSASLLEACERVEADLLVIGSRGRGGFTGLLLGAVGQQCAVHSPCPVSVVKPGPRTAPGERVQAAL
jgi:nucleotide-binding universal stress UspA family protein